MSVLLRYTDQRGILNTVNLGDVDLPFRIGRHSKNCDLPIADSIMSKLHCQIDVLGDDYAIEDLGSSNGTYVNDHRIDGKTPLCIGDTLRIGGTEFFIEELEDDSDDPLIGKTMHGYEFQEVLGEGGFGTVYRGIQIALHRAVAIKTIDVSGAPAAVTEQFLTEARHAGGLHHNHVVLVHDVIQDGARLYMIMELMEGGSAADLLREEEQLSEETVLRILMHIGSALAYAAQQRLVHRDVKPDNILMSDMGVYKLSDLGIAAPIAKNGMASQERVFGSAYYIAPEQARGSQIGPPADIYALGASVYHLLTGEPMFKGTPREVVAQHVSKEAPRLNGRVSAQLADLIARMLVKDPSKRINNGGIVEERAREILQSLTTASRFSSAGLPVRRRRRVHRRRGAGRSSRSSGRRRRR